MVAQVYRVWRIDCQCGSAIDYGEDEGSMPDKCEDCGEPVAEEED